jgi:hypothetical protein
MTITPLQNIQNIINTSFYKASINLYSVDIIEYLENEFGNFTIMCKCEIGNLKITRDRGQFIIDKLNEKENIYYNRYNQISSKNLFEEMHDLLKMLLYCKKIYN